VPAWVTALPVSGHVVVLACLLLDVYVAWAFYSPLLDDGFSDSDDYMWLRDAVHRDSLDTIFDPFLTTGNECMDTSYLPVQSLIYHVSINVLGQGALPVRALGIWLHALNACLLLLLTHRFTRSIPASHLTSLLFLLYPRNASTISWLCASLAHGLALLFYLSAFLALQTFLHRRTWWRWIFGLLIFAIAMLTKELAATLVAVFFLYDVLVVMGLRALWPPRLRTYLGMLARHGPFVLMLAGAIVIQRLKYDTGFVATKFGGMEFGWRNPLRLLELMTLLFHWGPIWSAEIDLLAIALIAAALMAGFYLTRHKPELLFILLWLPIILTPFTISNFREIYTLGRYVYEASAILGLLCAAVVVRLVRARPFLAWPAVCTAVVMLVAFAIRARETLT
jgi:hypothetical protein